MLTSSVLDVSLGAEFTKEKKSFETLGLKPVLYIFVAINHFLERSLNLNYFKIQKYVILFETNKKKVCHKNETKGVYLILFCTMFWMRLDYLVEVIILTPYLPTKKKNSSYALKTVFLYLSIYFVLFCIYWIILNSFLIPFEDEPGKQVKSAIRIKNISKNPVAFKFQTTGPKSCYMRPPGGTLAPDESLIATVFKFVEPPDNNEKQVGKKSRVKFKVMSLKVKEDVDYVPELFDERKDDVAVEQVLGVVFLDAERPCPALEKLNRQLAEAEAEVEARKRPPEDTGPKIVGEGLVIDEWKERRERYLARQQVDGVDSV